jgi:LysM repeat protein
MTDDSPQNRPQPRPRRAAPKPPPGPAGAPPTDDEASLAALEALQSLTPGEPVAAPQSAAPRPAPLRGSSAAHGQARPRTRPAASPGARRAAARIAAPVVFLVAVIVVLSITFQSGILGGAGGTAVTPAPKVTKTTSAGGGTSATTRKYVVKSGDTLSAIALKFNTTSSAIVDLNPGMSDSTVIVGDRIIVPRP